MKKLMVLVVMATIAFSLLPVKVSAYNHQILDIELPDDMKGQPIDMHIQFQKTCRGVNENRHSIRLFYNGKEIESQIYNLNFKSSNEISSCNIVFIYQGKGEYLLEYGEEVRDVNYKDHVKVNDIYYFTEPIPGYYAKINCYEIEEDGKSIFGICQEGVILGIEMGNKVIAMKEGVEKFEMKNWNQFFSFAFFHSDGKEKGSDEKLLGKKILVDGNLMVRVSIETSSRDGKLRTSGTYTYYYSPSAKRLFVKLRHESGEEWNGNITYAYLSSIHSKSKSIEDLNMGRIMPYIHLNGENGVEEYKLNTDPESRKFHWVISYKDNVRTGNPSWVSLDDKQKAYALFFSTPLLVTAATKEEINVPGLEVDGGGINMGKYGREGRGVAYDGIMEAFIGDYNKLENEGNAFASLSQYRNFEGKEGVYGKESIYNLSVILGIKHSLPFSTHLSALLGINIPHMEVEIWREGNKVASGAVNFRKIDFQLPRGNYTIRVYHEGLKGRRFVGEKYVELKDDEKTKIWCTFQSGIKVKSVKGSLIKIMDENGGIVFKNESNGEDSFPLPAMKRYTIQIFYHGFKMLEKVIFPVLPSTIECTFATYSFSLFLKDTLNLPFAGNATVFISSDEMEEKENIYGVKKGERYLFSSLPSASYTLSISYKGETINKKIKIPEERTKEVILPVEYKIKVKTYDSRGFPVSARVFFERGDKEIEKRNLPPGIYRVNVYKGEKKIAARDIFINGDAEYGIVTSKFSPYPLILPMLLIAGIILTRKKEGIIAFLLSIAIILPWWKVKGISSTSLYLFPPTMIEMGKEYGSIVAMPSIFAYAIYLSLLLIIISMVLIFLGRLRKFSMIPTITSFAIFLYAIHRFSSITLGEMKGNGEYSSWGLGIGFYLALVSLVLIIVRVIYYETGRSN